MTATATPRPMFVRAHDRPLSLWQSAVAQTIKQQSGTAGTEPILRHPLMRAVSKQILVRKSGGFGLIDPKSPDEDTRKARLADLTFEFARTLSKAKDDPQRLRQIFTEAEVPFSDDDYTGWASCLTTYNELYDAGYTVMPYNDWTLPTGGNGKLDYGVIDYTLPADSKVAIIGDWGTGLPDAQALLQDIVDNHSPAAIIHLGDIYYSGTVSECTDAFTNIINTVYNNARTVPVFTLPGNHDYYDWGLGYYGMLPGLNTGIPAGGTQSAAQVASYFCLRTADGAWQFLGMDTGYNDSDPTNAEDPLTAGPALQPTEITWHQDKLENFTGTTILLSHHQLFSAVAKINGDASTYDYLPYLNASLYATFSDYFSTNVALWLWGHEHNFAMYQDGLWGLTKGRLLGCSAYEEFVSSDPYTVQYAQVPYLLTPPAGQLGTNTVDGQAFYNHAYAIIDFSATPPTIGYYQFPAYYTGPPPLQGSTLLYSETITAPNPPSQGPVASGTTVALLGQEALYVSTLDDGWEGYYPTLSALTASSTQSAVGLIITASSTGDLSDGDTVTIQTTESAASTAPYLGTALYENSCYYVASDSGDTQWTVKKKTLTNGTTINMYDAVYFISNNSIGNGPNQILHSYSDDGTMYLTTSDASAGPLYYWRLVPAP